MAAELFAFVGIAALVIVTPGQDTALTIRNTLLGARRAGTPTPGPGRRPPSGISQQAGEPEDGGVLHEPVAAVRSR
jgi:hypothetical protein